MKGERSSSSSSQLHDDPLMMQLNKKNTHPNHNRNHGSSSNREKIRATTTTILPQEIIDEILYRLPVKSLLRFKCISKRWLSALSDSNFNLYYKRKSSSVFTITSTGKIPSHYSIDDDNASSVKVFSLNVPPLNILDDQYNNSNHYWLRTISNACNGLVLLRISKDSLALFNPSTHCYSVKALTLDSLDSTKTSFYSLRIGLCYDASIDDYKALVIFPAHNYRVFVSCLKSKRWVKITHVPFDVRLSIRGPLVNGHIHWTIETTIAYFEATRNAFEALPSPPNHHQYLIIGSGILDECLCIARRRRNTIKDVEVVAMKKYGVAESWTTLYVLSILEISRCVWRMCPILLTKNGEEVLFMRNQEEIWAYNPTSKSYRKFDIPERYLYATSVMQTIVSPGVVLDAEQYSSIPGLKY